MKEEIKSIVEQISKLCSGLWNKFETADNDLFNSYYENELYTEEQKQEVSKDLRYFKGKTSEFQAVLNGIDNFIEEQQDELLI